MTANSTNEAIDEESTDRRTFLRAAALASATLGAEAPQPSPTDVREALEQGHAPFTTTQEVADRVGRTERAVRPVLRRLQRAGEVGSKQYDEHEPAIWWLWSDDRAGVGVPNPGSGD